MAKVTFKTKARDVLTVEGELAWRYISIPKFTRAHCDMNAFRSHEKYHSYANSDLFPGMLERIAKEKLCFRDHDRTLRLDRIPPGVTVDASGFLLSISFDA